MAWASIDGRKQEQFTKVPSEMGSKMESAISPTDMGYRYQAFGRMAKNIDSLFSDEELLHY